MSVGDYERFPRRADGDIRNKGRDPAQVAATELLSDDFATSLVATPVPTCPARSQPESGIQCSASSS